MAKREVRRPTEEAALANVDREMRKNRDTVERNMRRILQNPNGKDPESLRKALAFFARR